MSFLHSPPHLAGSQALPKQRFAGPHPVAKPLHLHSRMRRPQPMRLLTIATFSCTLAIAACGRAETTAAAAAPGAPAATPTATTGAADAASPAAAVSPSREI